MGPNDAHKICGCEVHSQLIGHVMCLQMINDCMNGWLFIVKKQGNWPRASMSSPDAFLMYGWYPVSRSLPKDTYAE